MNACSLAFVFALAAPAPHAGAPPPPPGAPWWQEAVFYEIYPRSFQDSNGDGIGDLNGITSRLDYLAGLGVDALWITPFYPSPQVDFGYDVADFEAVDPQFGTLADFDRLVAEAKKRGIRIVTDMVLNHTSDQHRFFRDARSSRESPHRDFYVWRDGTRDHPPNNWYSGFGPTAWTFDEKTGQYYYHFFYVEQPDLNWRNPAVEKAMLDACRFWLAPGVAGFRLDAVNWLFEDPALRENPVLPRPRMESAEESERLESGQPASVLALYKRATHVRRSNVALRRGDYAAVGDDPDVFAYRRRAPGQTVLVALNMSGVERPLPASPEVAAGPLRVLLSTNRARTASVRGAGLRLAPWEALVLELPRR